MTRAGNPGKDGKLTELLDRAFDGLPFDSVKQLFDNIDDKIFSAQHYPYVDRHYRSKDRAYMSDLHQYLRDKIKRLEKERKR